MSKRVGDIYGTYSGPAYVVWSHRESMSIVSYSQMKCPRIICSINKTCWPFQFRSSFLSCESSVGRSVRWRFILAFTLHSCLASSSVLSDRHDIDSLCQSYINRKLPIVVLALSPCKHREIWFQYSSDNYIRPSNLSRVCSTIDLLVHHNRNTLRPFQSFATKSTIQSSGGGLPESFTYP